MQTIFFTTLFYVANPVKLNAFFYPIGQYPIIE